ncbi:MAG TPA: adenylyltransferase/cytidyltransferase family protein [Patescibacteria group bacterium]|nr:adenylyltransferase/cytidyltransferase family protein [Patescibacteria group bacterium]
MENIISDKQLKKLAPQLHTNYARLVLVGGCFDLIHQGHLQFLTKAREAGDALVLLLESDKAVTKRKGESRPIHTQIQRAKTLLATSLVDTIILLPYPFEDKDYDRLVMTIKPAIIATTKGDPFLHHKERQADLIGAKVVEVIDRLPHYSTTQLIKNKV